MNLPGSSANRHAKSTAQGEPQGSPNLANGHVRQCTGFSSGTTAAICITPFRLAPWHMLAMKLHTIQAQADQLAASHGIVNKCTIGLLDLFKRLAPATFSYDLCYNPRRVLTKPSRPTHNSGADNEKWDLILRVGDLLGDEEGRKYIIMDLLGHGTFGQVVKVRDVASGTLAAIKVIKNQTSYFNQSMMEVTVLELLNTKHDPHDRRHIVRMRDTFVFKSHLCIVVELLGSNLYELIKQNGYRGFSLGLCRLFLAQCLDTLQTLRNARIIHCDLKPENILLVTSDSPMIKIIDFGSACHEHQTVYTYIQSRFYRSPEVILGLPYSSTIDMWSLGCIAAELFLGLPIFPGSSNYDQMARIMDTLGMPPKHLLDMGKDSRLYFTRDPSTSRWSLKTREQYNQDTGHQEGPSKKYFSSSDLAQIIANYTPKGTGSKGSSSVARTGGSMGSPAGLPDTNDKLQRESFIDFCYGLLQWNPVERWSPAQALHHPFITGRQYTGHYMPDKAGHFPPGLGYRGGGVKGRPDCRYDDLVRGPQDALKHLGDRAFP